MSLRRQCVGCATWHAYISKESYKTDLNKSKETYKRDLNQSKETRQKDLLANETCVTVQTVYSMCHLPHLHVKTNIQKTPKQKKRDTKETETSPKRRTKTTGLLRRYVTVQAVYLMCHLAPTTIRQGVATNSRLLKIIGLFCRIWSL